MSKPFRERVEHASSALIQGLVFVPLCTLTGALLGLATGLLIGHPGQGLLWGAGGSLLLAAFAVPCAVGAPVGPGAFLEWFVSGVFAVQLAVAAAVVVGVWVGRLIPGSAGPIIGFCAGFSTYGSSLVLLDILLGDGIETDERIVGGSEDLSPFEKIKEHADALGRIRRGPGAPKGEAAWQRAWRLYQGQARAARETFYEPL